MPQFQHLGLLDLSHVMDHYLHHLRLESASERSVLDLKSFVAWLADRGIHFPTDLPISVLIEYQNVLASNSNATLSPAVKVHRLEVAIDFCQWLTSARVIAITITLPSNES